MALKKRRLAGSVAGFVRRRASVAECKRVGAVDFATLDLKKAVAGADLLVFCTPIAQMLPLLQRMLPWIKDGAIVTDVGSVKAGVVSDLEQLLALTGAHFVGSHPMAGSEKTGVSAARPGLFVDAICVVTPGRKSNPGAVRQVEALWKSVGGRVLRLSPEVHDHWVSHTSHLPHVLAATLANTVLDSRQPKQQAALCANGFRDTTRIASGSPEMWRDIAVANRQNLARAVDLFMEKLRQFKGALKRRDEKEIAKFFEQAKQRRDNWVKNVCSNSPE
jgi:prephenate dehydrogenase